MTLRQAQGSRVLEALEADCAADPELREVFLAMPSWTDDEIPYAREQASELGLPVERWRQHVARLIALGLATYGPVRREEHARPVGSSYWLTQLGAALQRAMEAV